MYLSRLILDRRSPQVRKEIANLYELHRTVMGAFPEHMGADERVLYRLDIHPNTGIPTLLVQSSHKPDWGYLSIAGKNYLLTESDLPVEVENPAMKSFSLSLQAEQLFTFRLRANPTVKKHRQGEKQGRRIGLAREGDQLKWLQRKLEAGGGALISAYVTQNTQAKGELFREDEKHILHYQSVLFDGLLKVKDPARFTETLQAGIGSAKGFGFGLLSLAPVRG